LDMRVIMRRRFENSCNTTMTLHTSTETGVSLKSHKAQI
jgi:hypothetical protein